jgi:hypothetical protein
VGLEQFAELWIPVATMISRVADRMSENEILRRRLSSILCLSDFVPSRSHPGA